MMLFSLVLTVLLLFSAVGTKSPSGSSGRRVSIIFINFIAHLVVTWQFSFH